MPNIKSNDELNKLVHDFRDISEANVNTTKSLQVNLKELEVKLAKSVKDNADLRVKKEAEAKAFEAKFMNMEKSLAKLSMNGNFAKDNIDGVKKSMHAMFVKGDLAFKDESVVKYLRTDVLPSGGLFVHDEVSKIILKEVLEVSDIQSLAKIKTMSGKRYVMPLLTGRPVSDWTGEGETYAEGTMSFGELDLNLRKHTVVVELTQEELDFSSVNMVDEVLKAVAEEFAQKEGYNFLLGTGVNRPNGFMVDPTIVAAASESATSATLAFDDLISMTGKVPKAYRNSLFGMNQQTVVTLMLEKDTTNQYLWQNSSRFDASPTIAGYGYRVHPDLVDVAASAYPVFFGDLSKGYTIGVNDSIRFVRDNITLATEGKIRLIFHKYTGGAPVLREAINILKIKA